MEINKNGKFLFDIIDNRVIFLFEKLEIIINLSIIKEISFIKEKKKKLRMIKMYL